MNVFKDFVNVFGDFLWVSWVCSATAATFSKFSRVFSAFSIFSVFRNFLRVSGCNLNVQSRLRLVIRKLYTFSTVNDSSTLLVKKLVQGTLCRVKPSMQNRLVKELCVCDHVVCVKRVARVCVCVPKPFLHRAWYEYAGGWRGHMRLHPTKLLI